LVFTLKGENRPGDVPRPGWRGERTCQAELHEPTAYVFGNELGLRTTHIREAWKLTSAAAKITGLRFQ